MKRDELKQDDMRQDDVKQGRRLRYKLDHKLGQDTGGRAGQRGRAGRQLSSLDDHYRYQTAIHKS
jgi:hypothetical protein